jgi:hypothetical protein
MIGRIIGQLMAIDQLMLKFKQQLCNSIYSIKMPFFYTSEYSKKSDVVIGKIWRDIRLIYSPTGEYNSKS